MEYKDYYKTLGVKRDASEDDIKRSYRKLARKYHPDVSKEANAEERFKDVQEAYEVLKDKEKRTAYDQLGSNWKAGQDFRPPPHGFGGFEGGDFDGGDFSDFFSSIFGGQRRGGGGFHTGGGGFRQRGEDAHAKIAITLEEAYRGGEKSIQLRTSEVDRQGRVHPKIQTLKVNIPAGIATGQQLRLAKQGSPGIGNAPPGDLYLEVEVLPHRLFTLQGKDVYLTLPIAPWEAALGEKITVPTLSGSVQMKIAPGSQAGQKLRLKEKGLPGKPVAGDQYVLLQIVTPPVHNDEQKALYEKMAKDMPFNPRKDLF